MNYMDYCFLVVLILCGLAGMYQGLINVIIGFASIICSYLIAIAGYHSVASFIKLHTPIYNLLKQATQSKMNGSAISLPKTNLAGVSDNIVNTLMSKIYVPPVLRDFIINQTHIDIKHFDTAQTINALSQNVADVFINIMGFVLIFAVVQTIFTVIHVLLHHLFMLPVLHEINMIGGLAAGIFEGCVILYVICAGWSLLAGWDIYKAVFAGIKASKYAKWFYNHNLLIDILVKYKII